MSSFKFADGHPLQGFAPNRIEDISSGSVNVSAWLAFCFPEDSITYQINDTGETATLQAGWVRVINSSVSTITFSGFTNAKCEIM